MGNPKSINDVDTGRLLKEIEKTNTSIMIAGSAGTGKTYLLNKALQENDNNIFLVNGSVNYEEHILLMDSNISEIYHVSLIIKKIIEYIKTHYTDEYLSKFMLTENYIDSVLKKIKMMYLTGLYNNAKNIVDSDTYEHPEILMESFLNILLNNIDISKVFLIIDSFDKGNNASTLYQRLIYEKLRKYMTIVLAISDKETISSDERLNEFSTDNKILKLEYTKDIEIVSSVLDEEIMNYVRRFGNFKTLFNSRRLLGDETILLMIQKTNGNLFDMLNAIRYFYKHMPELTKEEYSPFILNYIDKEINKSPIISGIIPICRKLFIKPQN